MPQSRRTWPPRLSPRIRSSAGSRARFRRRPRGAWRPRRSSGDAQGMPTKSSSVLAFHQPPSKNPAMSALHGSREIARQPTLPPAEVGAVGAARSRGARLAVVLAAAIPFLVYLRTMAPTVYGLDSAELTTGSYVLGIVHSPGSPTFLLLGHLFSWLPVGDVGYRVNLVSVAGAAAAMAAFCAVLLRLLDDPIAAAAGTWLLAFTYYFWVSAVAAELYSLQAFFLAALIWLSLRWRSEQRPWQLYL